jgi:hypothetical protein
MAFSPQANYLPDKDTKIYIWSTSVKKASYRVFLRRKFSDCPWKPLANSTIQTNGVYLLTPKSWIWKLFLNTTVLLNNTHHSYAGIIGQYASSC